MANRLMSGDLHNHCLNASRDSTLAIKTLPGLMLAMLREDGWKEMARPIDGKVFTHDSIEEWILGEPWSGLNFPSWDMLYAILDRSDTGREARKMLIKRGAPENGSAEDVRKATAPGDSYSEVGQKTGKRVSKQRVHQIVKGLDGNTYSPRIRLHPDPTRAAETIIDRRGPGYAGDLATAILAKVATSATEP
jgi:hypothetical protein